MAAPEHAPDLPNSTDRLRSAAESGTSRRRRGKSNVIPTSPIGGALSPNHSHMRQLRRISKRKRTGFLQFARKHSCTIPLLLLLAIVSLYAANPTESNVIHHFIFLSYKQTPPQDPGAAVRYGKGLWDVAFVCFYTVFLSFTREFVMQELLRPLSRYCGVKRSKQERFMEQMYTAIYFGCTGPVGLYIMSRTPLWFFNTAGMYEGFPHKTHEAAFKFYYLFQAAYWAQQALVMLLGLEKPRKDYYELVGHHIVTLALIALSYRFHFTYMGLPVYITHDVSDFFLAISKSLHYMDSPIIGPFFVTNIFVWTYLRHYQNLRIIFSLFNEFQTVGPYELNWETQQYKCWISNIITFVLLASLQALNLFWLYCLLRSAYRFAVHNIKKDDRSDDSEPEEVEENNDGKNTKTVSLPNGHGFTDGSASIDTKHIANGNTNTARRP